MARIVFFLLVFMLLVVAFTEMNPEAEHASTNNNNKAGRTRFVKYLDEESYPHFINASNVEIVYFLKKDSRRLQAFLREYENSAERLAAFGIELGLVDCQQRMISDYCQDDRSLQYAFGFRNGVEKIALSLDTLFDVDSIVASALHLSLIHNVPIIQTLSERKSLETKCKGRYNIIFSYQKALGTYEHRVFMELAYTFLDKYVFAMTISELAVQDLRHFNDESFKSIDNSGRNSNIEPTLWVLFCQSVTHQKRDCTQNIYYGKFYYLDVFHFVQSLEAPLWVEFPAQQTGEEIPYNISEIHLLFVLMKEEDDGDAQFNNLLSTYKHLGQMFAGSMGLIFVRLVNASDEGLMKLGLPPRQELESKPKIAWKFKGQDPLIWKQDCDDVQQFVLGHLRSDDVDHLESPMKLHSAEYQIWEENNEEQLEEMIELQQDDMVAEFVRLSTIDATHLHQLNETNFLSSLEKTPLSLVLFYVEWDSNCQVTLQTLNEVQSSLGDDIDKPLLAKINCFDWPKTCQNNNVTLYPTIKLFMKKDSQWFPYEDLIQKEAILTALQLFELRNPLLLHNKEEALKFSTGHFPIDFSSSTKPSFVILVGFSATQQDQGMGLVNELVSWLMGKSLIGFVEGETAEKIGSEFEAELPFVIQCKLMDSLKPFVVFHKEILNQLRDIKYDDLKLQINENQLNIFGELSVKNFPLYRQRPAQDLVIYFRSLEQNDDDPTWNSIGKVAQSAEHSHLLFTWMKINDSLAKSLMSFYKVQNITASVVRIQFQRGMYSVLEGDELKDVQSFISWLDGTLLTPAIHTGNLKSGDWKPLHPGFDYLRLIDEDTRGFTENDADVPSVNNKDLENSDNYKDKQSPGRSSLNELRSDKRFLRVSYKSKESPLTVKGKWRKMQDDYNVHRSEL